MTQLSRAVQERRAPKEVEQDSPERRRWRQLDFLPTPPWAGRAGAELIKRVSPDTVSVWEPACGLGHMAQPLREYFPTVTASDIYPHGYGSIVDFLNDPPIDFEADFICTNPPFSKAAAFIRRGMRHARHGVAILCRLSFLEGAERYKLFYEFGYGLSYLAPFSERVSMQIGSWDPNLSSATAYAYFVFLRGGNGADHPQIIPIPPGTRARLTRPDDIRRFCREKPAPLFEGEDNAEGQGVGAGA